MASVVGRTSRVMMSWRTLCKWLQTGQETLILSICQFSGVDIPSPCLELGDL